MHSEMEASIEQLEKVKAEGQSARDALATQEKELIQLRKSTKDLARARNELTQLRQQRNQTPNAATPTAKTGATKNGPSAFPPGTYVNRESLAFAGYATPEATIQSLAWAAIKGQYDIAPHAVLAELQSQDQNFMEGLRGAMQATGPLLQGMQVVAQKTLADGHVELLVKLDVESSPDNQADIPPQFNIIPMKQVDNEWKMSDQTRDYSPDWSKNGEVRVFAK